MGSSGEESQKMRCDIRHALADIYRLWDTVVVTSAHVVL
jgi:hypothetical protein